MTYQEIGCPTCSSPPTHQWLSSSADWMARCANHHVWAVARNVRLHDPQSSAAESPKPDWWPECPWPEDVWPMTLHGVSQAIDRDKITAISGPLMRHGWRMAEEAILMRLRARPGLKFPEPAAWKMITMETLPTLNRPVWLYDAENNFGPIIGCRSINGKSYRWFRCYYGEFYYDGKKGWVTTINTPGQSDLTPTHWMPLPEPPQK